MKTNQYRSHSIAAALAATFVTTVLVSSLVESFEPTQLLQIEGEAAPEAVIALERRPSRIRPIGPDTCAHPAPGWCWPGALFFPRRAR